MSAYTYPAWSYASNGEYATPMRIEMPAFTRFECSHSAQRVIQIGAAQIPRDMGNSYYRALIDTSDPLGAISARYARRDPECFLKWISQYGIISSNFRIGRAIESIVLETFGLLSNNIGHPQTFKIWDQRSNKFITTRPDGVAYDKDGNLIIFEVKSLQPGKVLYFNKQLRAQSGIRNPHGGTKHVIVLACYRCLEEQSFPRPSRAFKLSKHTELKLVSKTGDMYRWQWSGRRGINQAIGFWKKVKLDAINEESFDLNDGPCANLIGKFDNTFSTPHP